MATLTDLLGSRARVKVIQGLLDEREDGEALSVPMVAERAGIHRRTAYEHLPELEAAGLVVVERRERNRKFYRLNEEQATVQALRELGEALGDLEAALEVKAGVGRRGT